MDINVLLDDVMGRDVTVTTEYGDIHLRYGTHRVSIFHIAQIIAPSSVEDFSLLLQKWTSLLARAIIEWDITDNGEPYPITLDTINELPYTVVNEMISTIHKDYESYTNALWSSRNKKQEDVSDEDDV